MNGKLTPEETRDYFWMYRQVHSSKCCAYSRKYQERNPGKFKAYQKRFRKDNEHRYRDWALKKNYGLSLMAYNLLLCEQRGRCAICSGLPNGQGRLHVDHCHETNEIRGLLCFSCNAGIGSLKDNPKILQAAAEYLS